MSIESLERDYMSAVAKDIIQLKFKPRMTLKQVEAVFYRIMRKHGIKRGTEEGHGVVRDNFEWTICEELFLSRVHVVDRFLLEEPPKDLLHY